jgi:BirA family transcriptional regulator, biotin operon repressor / biotin---[acetyl-CoA-carboxylase] ligase
MQLDPSAVAAGVRLTALQTIDSTNKEALRRARQGKRGPLWITAAEQTAGRGRMDRSWESSAGNLHASLLLHDPAPFERAPELTFVAALAVRDAVIAEAPTLAEQLAFKWPNDLLLAGKKCAGILIEGEVDPGKSLIVVIGIGVNCARHPADAAYPATNLRAHAAVTPEQLLPRLSAAMVRRMAQWDRGGGFTTVLAEWLKAASGIGEPIRVRNGGAERTGRFIGLDQSGRLLLERAGGIEKISAGDVFPFARRDSGPVRTQTG